MQLSELVVSTCKWFCKPVQMLWTLACVPCVCGQHLTHCKLHGSTIYKLYLQEEGLSICTGHKVVYPKQVVSQYSHCWFLTGTFRLLEEHYLTQTEVLKLSPQLWEIHNSWWVFCVGCSGWCPEGVQNPFSSTGDSSSETQFLFPFLFFLLSLILVCCWVTPVGVLGLCSIFPDKAGCLASKPLEFTGPKFVLVFHREVDRLNLPIFLYLLSGY